MTIGNMKILLSDFLPPVLIKAIRKAKKTFRGLKRKKNDPIKERMYPFNYVPLSLNPKWILDIGANEGHISLAALKTFENCEVICFEPVSATFNILKNNLYEYTKRVHLFNTALSDVNSNLEMNITTASGANSINPQSEFHKIINPNVKEIKKEKITAIKLDEAAKTFPASYIDIMKIDVEGHEMNVLKGGINFIRDNVDTIIIEISFQRDISWEHQTFMDIFNLLESLDFRLINIYDLYNSSVKTNSSDMMLTQCDCVFRHRSKLKMPETRDFIFE